MSCNSMMVNAVINQLRAKHSNAPQNEIKIPENVFVPTIPDTATSASSETHLFHMYLTVSQ